MRRSVELACRIIGRRSSAGCCETCYRPRRLGGNMRRNLPAPEEIRSLVKSPVAYRFQYAEGARGSMLLFHGLVRDFTFAARLKGRDEPLSALFYLPAQPNVHYSAILMSKAEEMFLTG